ncbi:LVIVD repeat-containing protein [Eudoraea sp.]|uniref:LVIVD repeat-containing protein n=1 Tax=Eudoraea sp. TaxID=1979955 RepID=UPI003C706DB9
MKNCIITLLVVLGLVSCNKKEEGDFADYLVATPLTMSLADFKNSVDVVAPRPINESGKIYAYENYIFVNDKYKGVHVIDNSDPNSPQKISFIKIAGNVDISIKGNFLYADSLTDLMVLDISEINAIKIVNRLEDVLRDNIVWPNADIYEYDGIDYENEILVGWDVKIESRLISEVNSRFDDQIFLAETANDSQVGQGGSLARFKIVNDYLYAVDSHTINVFEISDLENPRDLEDVYAGFDIETIFNKGNNLFLGSMRGMYIYDITSPATPTFISEFQHGTACDPVVVDGDYAYVTLRGGNNCGATESGLFIVDISDLTTPVLATSYAMDEPYGLGIKDNKLFICDGKSGLKIYDKTDIENLVLLNHYENNITFDVIPMNETLIMIGDDILYQYRYLDNDIELISSMNLN